MFRGQRRRRRRLSLFVCIPTTRKCPQQLPSQPAASNKCLARRGRSGRPPPSTTSATCRRRRRRRRPLELAPEKPAKWPIVFGFAVVCIPNSCKWPIGRRTRLELTWSSPGTLSARLHLTSSASEPSEAAGQTASQVTLAEKVELTVCSLGGRKLAARPINRSPGLAAAC